MKNRGRYLGLTLPAALFLIILGMADISRGATPQIAAGADHTIMLRSDGTLWGSGLNVFGQLGDGTSISRNAPVRIGADSNWAAVAAGSEHTLALKADGSLWSWGANQSGQLGIGSTVGKTQPVRIGIANDWTAVSAGGASSFALKADGTLWAWGRNNIGQLGNGDTADKNVPVQVANMGTSRYVAISTGGEHALALQADGTLWAWGSNQFGQIAQSPADLTAHSTPVQVGADSDWSALSAGGLHSMALKADGTLWVWGSNKFGQIAQNPADLTPHATPVQVGTDRDWVTLSAGELHSVAVKRNGTLWAWGDNTGGQLGDGASTDRNIPMQVTASAGITDIVAVATGAFHSLALKANGELYSWGDNGSGQLGDGTTASSFSPLLVTTDVISWVGIEPGGEFAVARRSNGTLWAWGDNAKGQLGDNTLASHSAPAAVGTAVNWVAAATGWSHSMALQADGTLWAWGENTSGQLGDGTTTNRQVPTRITATSNWAAVAAGDFHTLALQADGTLWAWGNNASGQLGDGTTINRTLPVQIVTGNPGNFDSHWVAIAAGGSHSLALQADGTLWVWGDNSSGQLGDTAFGTGSNTPQQVISFNPPTLGWNSSWVAIAAGLSHSLALQADGTLWAWGANGSGQLGDGAAVNRATPVQVQNPGAAPYLAIAAGDSYSVARQADGTLWSWGNNTSGQLGIGVNDPDPLQPVPHPTPLRENSGAGDWVAAGSGASHAVALKAAGTLVAWGNNASGQLGDGTTANRSAPPSPQEARIAVTPATIAFGTVAIGNAPALTFTIGNTGVAPLTVTALNLSGADKAMFSVTSGACGSTLPFNVAAGGSCTIQATFQPAAPAGVRNATLTIVSSDPNFPGQTVEFTATAVAPFIINTSASPAAGGTISPSGTVFVVPGSSQTFAITPNTGYHVTDVTLNGVSKGAVATLTVPAVAANATVQASFALDTYTVTSSPGANGSITGPATASHGDTPTYTITANTGFHVADVTVNGVSKGAVTSLTLPLLTANATVAASFAVNAYTVTRTGANGVIAGPATANHGDAPTYTITPNTGYHLVDVTVDGVSKGAVTSVTLAPLTADATITATFAVNTFIVTRNAGLGGVITGPATANYGDAPTYTVTPDTGYHVTDVMVNGVSRGALASVTLPAVTGDVTVAATFAVNVFIPDGDANNDGRVDVADALKALRIAVGLAAPTATELLHGDVAPLDSDGVPAPDARITVADALLILRKVVGVTSGW